MMPEPEYYAEMARRAVKRARREPPASLPADRRRLVAAVEQALHSRHRRRVVLRRVRAVGAVAASLALVVGGLALWQRLGGTVVAVNPAAPAADSSAPLLGPRAVDHSLAVLSIGEGVGGSVIGGAGEAPVPIARGMKLSAGARLVAPATGEVRIGGIEGTTLTLEKSGELAVADAGATRRFELQTGAVRVQVAKLRSGERFLVDTADAEIEVHGTQFRVAVAPADRKCADGTTTRVSVTEGVVSVRWHGAEARVLPGGEWPQSCAAAESPAEVRPVPVLRRATRAVSRRIASAERAPSVVASPRLPSPAAVAAPPASPAHAEAPAPGEAPPLVDIPASPSPTAAIRHAPPPPPASELAAQNNLFASAVRAKRQGREATAIQLFTRLVAAYPGSPLVESALAQRMKLLAARDPAQGARAAADYLARFPGGFARADAQRLLLEIREP